jgi:hypothetical protein
MNKINLGLDNSVLYAGCDVEVVAGRKNLTTPVAESVEIIGKNINELVKSIPKENREEVTLTGPMAVWAYLIVFHAVVHAFKKIYYDDGRNPVVLIAAHG